MCRTLQPITGEALSGTSAITEDGARLDVAASGFWGGGFERAFFDMRISNPHAPSNRHPSPPVTENIKKQAYEERVREVEHGSFTPLSSLSQGSLLSSKWDQAYSSTIAWIRYSLCFSLLRSSIQCIRGARSTSGRASNQPILPIDLVSTEAIIFSSL